MNVRKANRPFDMPPINRTVPNSPASKAPQILLNDELILPRPDSAVVRSSHANEKLSQNNTDEFDL